EDSMKFYPVTDTDTIPALGLGTWKSTSREVAQAVTNALEIGYRHIDCAPIYQNENDVGEALESALSAGSVGREELWITSKLWNNAHAKKHVRPALEKTLRELRLDYLDLFLIHWPVHFRPGVVFPRRPEDFLPPDAIPVMETWQEMERMVKKGLCRFIGVCNFNLARLKDLYSQAAIKPLMNQIELHPYLQQEPMLDYCRANNILLTAYSPLGSADRPAALKKDNEPSLLDHQTITNIARNHNITPGQVLLSWGLARGTVVIPKSVNPARLAENFRAADIDLADSDIQAIAGLESNYRFVDGSFFQMPGSPYSTDDIWGEG
ncbi:MAG: aldo/keto reductase, partial [Desulforhopalus sp.]